jgi:hypothetical protein
MGMDSQSGLRRGVVERVEHEVQGPARTAGPGLADFTDPPLVKRLPRRHVRGVMPDGHRPAQPSRPGVLQGVCADGASGTVCAAAVRRHEQAGCSGHPLARLPGAAQPLRAGGALTPGLFSAFFPPPPACRCRPSALSLRPPPGRADLALSACPPHHSSGPARLSEALFQPRSASPQRLNTRLMCCC